MLDLTRILREFWKLQNQIWNDSIFSLVSLMRYSESVFMLSKLLKWRILKTEHKNVDKTRPAVISREMRQLIEKKCHLDMQLYEHGKKRFDKTSALFAPNSVR